MVFSPQFAAFQELYGFDKSVNPYWQMVPEGGEKTVYLDNAEGAAVQIADARIAQVSEAAANTSGKSRRIFVITGKLHGETFLEVRKDNFVKTKLEISVKKAKNVSLAFSFVSDKTGRTTVKNPSDVPRWMELLNDIYQPQTNISFTRRSTRSITINNNLGSEVDSIDAKLSEWEWDVIVRERDGSADINLFFVWKIAGNAAEGAHFPKGTTWKSDCLISDYKESSEKTEVIVMAHEIGHALGIRTDQHFHHPKNRGKFVMYFKSSFSGNEIPKVHADTVNP